MDLELGFRLLAAPVGELAVQGGTQPAPPIFSDTGHCRNDHLLVGGRLFPGARPDRVAV